MAEYSVEVDEKIRRKLFDFRNVRNQVAHGRDTVEGKEVADFIKMVKELEPKFKELKEKVEQNPRLLLDKEKARIEEQKAS